MKTKWFESRLLWGGLLVVGGVLFLLQNLGFFRFGDLFWGVLLGFGGLFFISWFVQDRQNWWALIPGLALISVAATIALDVFAPNVAEDWGGGVVLGGIGLSFWLIYLVERRFWWAIIPGGVLVTLAAMVGLENTMGGDGAVGIFFMGMGLTFALVALLPHDGQQGSLAWAWIPAGILLVMGFLFLAAAGEMLAYIWPVALIVVGGGMMFRALRRRG
jgi:hypothetical protein